MNHPLKVTIDCEEGLENMLIPSLLVQPFIENSFVHGFSELQKDAHIVIKIFKENSSICIQILDNGDAEGLPKKDHISRSTEITKQRIYETYNKVRLTTDFLHYGKINSKGYQVVIKLPYTK